MYVNLRMQIAQCPSAYANSLPARKGGGQVSLANRMGAWPDRPRPLLDPRVVLFCYRRLCVLGILGHHRHGAIEIGFIFIIIMRPSSVGGTAYCVALCLSVCPSVPCLLTLEHRSRVFVNLADVRYLLFCLHFRAAYSTAISAAQACYYSILRWRRCCDEFVSK